MSKQIAFLFPGQGAQYVGMGKDFYDTFLVAKETYQEADEILGYSLSKIIFEGPEKTLVETKNSQLAIFVTSVALLRVLEKELPEIKPSICAGLSLGEYTALYASKRLSFKETLLLVQKRAVFMNEACERTSGTMAAVLGMKGEDVEKGISGISGVSVANYNCPGQVVISGTAEGVEKASSVLKEKGAKRVLPLTVHGAFHSPLMESAERELSPFVKEAKVQESDIDFVMNVSGDFCSQVEEIQKNLIYQVTSSVRWQQGIEAMEKRGVDLYIEIGCGKTLSGMNRKMGVNALTLSLDKVIDLEGIAKKIALEV